jgi:DNA-binding LacI/PurR family transcriptional regulator
VLFALTPVAKRSKLQPVARSSDVGKLKSIEDIARLAGVSKSTVSRALNDSPLVGIETRERIAAIVKEHSFRPSAVARNLSNRSSRTIAFVTEAYGPGDTCELFDLFSAEIMGGIASGLYSLGYDLLVVTVDSAKDDWAASYLDSGKVDGFILMPCMEQSRHVKRLLAMGAPFVSWGRSSGEHCTVRGDDRRGGRLAGERLLSIGRKRIAFIGGELDDPEAQDRYLGFSEALKDAGLDPAALSTRGDYSEERAERDMACLLAKAPDLDAVFAASDYMALAAMRAIKASGRRVPDDVAVVGYDNLSIAAYATPSLTTVSQGVPAAGKILARDLVAFLEKGIITTTTMPVELIQRESA